MKDQHKFILQSYDPERVNEAPGVLRQALNEAANNAELQSFADSEAAFDQAFRDKLNSVPVPEGLKDRILDRVNVEKKPVVGGATSPTWWRSAGLISAAATILIALGILFLFSQQPIQAYTSPELEAFIDASAEYSDRIENLIYNTELDAIKAILIERQSPFPQHLPQSVEKLGEIGCKPVKINGIQASLICMKDERVYHLYVTDRTHFPEQKDLPKEVRLQCGEYATATWTTETQVFVLTAQGNEKCLDKLF